MEKGGHKAPNIEALSESLNHPLKASLLSPLTTEGSPDRSLLIEKPPFGT